MYAEKINLIYKENTSGKGGGFIGIVLVVLILLYVYGTLYSNVQNKLAKANWSEQRCNPKYIFWSGFLSPNKDPMKETQRNFDRCVASSIYKDPSLSREIKTNEEYINKNKKEIKDNASKGVNALDDMKEKWEKDIDEKDMKVQNIKSDVSSIFSKQNYIHSEVANATLKMFKVLQNILIYIKDIVMFKISRAKNNLNMNKTHLEYMDEYKDAYVDYDKAYDNLKKMDYVTAINSARKSIKKFEELSKKLDKFMDDHYVDIVEMTDGCYNLEYNLSDKSCDTLFPTLNRDIINYYPLIKDSL